jgi:hypothetical protein
MSDPDELYTLRAQFWLGHYALAVEEAKSVARRPMSPLLKEEREEFLARSNLALGNFSASGGSTPSTYLYSVITNSICSWLYYFSLGISFVVDPPPRLRFL